jgi:hypothetical protein
MRHKPNKKASKKTRRRKSRPRKQVVDELFSFAAGLLLGHLTGRGGFPPSFVVRGCPCICHTFGQVPPLGAPSCPPDCPTAGSRFDGCHACDCPSGEHHKHHLTKGEQSAVS